jgi:hypothetical protein
MSSTIVYQYAEGEAMRVTITGAGADGVACWLSVRKVGSSGEPKHWDCWPDGPGVWGYNFAAGDTDEVGRFSIVAYVTLGSSELVRTVPSEFSIAPIQP